MNKSEGLVTIFKRFFYSLFKSVWKKSFTESNIHHAFKKPSIWPVDDSYMVSTLIIPLKDELDDLSYLKTSKTAVDVHTLRRELIKSPSKERTD